MFVLEAIDSILRKTLAFKMKVQPNYNHYSMNQISDNVQIIESIIEKIQNYEVYVTS